uniref:Uncharacterized protein n=1 Tax=Romanomermis culicivorax TaxID=13658 RepID=A0A915KDZ7_ROMCU
MEGTPAPPAGFVAQGLPPGIPMDSTLEVVGQMESMNLLVGLRISGPKVAQRALEFIADRTIGATTVNKILLDIERSSPAVDAVHRAVEQASRNPQPTAVVAVSPSTTTTGDQTLAEIAQWQPVAASTNSHIEVANAFGETLPAIMTTSVSSRHHHF